LYIDRRKEIKENLENIKKDIKQNQIPGYSEPQLVCVTKNFPLEDLLIANELGQKIFAENRVQELLEKQTTFANLPDDLKQKYDFKWHFIGTLQRNKVRDIVGIVDLIHSVHDLKILRRIDTVSKQRDLISEVLIQVNVTEEKSKHGFLIKELDDVILATKELDNVKLRGLMTMAPFFEKDEVHKSQAIFAKLRELLEKYQKELTKDFNQLSMGMSADYVYALEEGTTLIRIGTDIFGKRNYNL